MKRKTESGKLEFETGPCLPVGKFEVESTSSDPHWAGFIEVKFKAGDILVRWLGEKEWKSVTWYEIMWVADALPIPIAENIEMLKDNAKTEGYTEGLVIAQEKVRKDAEMIDMEARQKREGFFVHKLPHEQKRSRKPL